MNRSLALLLLLLLFCVCPSIGRIPDPVNHKSRYDPEKYVKLWYCLSTEIVFLPLEKRIENFLGQLMYQISVKGGNDAFCADQGCFYIYIPRYKGAEYQNWVERVQDLVTWHFDDFKDLIIGEARDPKAPTSELISGMVIWDDAEMAELRFGHHPGSYATQRIEFRVLMNTTTFGNNVSDVAFAMNRANVTFTHSYHNKTDYIGLIDLTFGKNYVDGVEFVMSFTGKFPKSIFRNHTHRLFEFSREFYQMKDSLSGYIAGLNNWDILMVPADGMRQDEQQRFIIEYYMPFPEYKLFDLSCVYNKTFSERDNSVSSITLGKMSEYVSKTFNQTIDNSTSLVLQTLLLSQHTNESLILNAFNNTLEPRMAISERKNDVSIVVTQRFNISTKVEKEDVEKAIKKSCCDLEKTPAVFDNMWEMLKSSFHGIMNIQCYDKAQFQ